MQFAAHLVFSKLKACRFHITGSITRPRISIFDEIEFFFYHLIEPPGQILLWQNLVNQSAKVDLLSANLNPLLTQFCKHLQMTKSLHKSCNKIFAFRFGKLVQKPCISTKKYIFAIFFWIGNKINFIIVTISKSQSKDSFLVKTVVISSTIPRQECFLAVLNILLFEIQGNCHGANDMTEEFKVNHHKV